MISDIVSDIVISRLPWYLQALNQMAKEGLHTESYKELADRVGLTAAQIRKDLSYFCGFGKQGSGYSIYILIDQLRQILNLDRIWRVAIVGAGDLRRALTRYQGFVNRGIDVALIFDNHPNVVGKKVGSITVRHIETMADVGIKMSILTVPSETAQSKAECLLMAGVKAILNYTP